MADPSVGTTTNRHNANNGTTVIDSSTNGHIRQNSHDLDEQPNKRVKLDSTLSHTAQEAQPAREKGVAPIKKEYLLPIDRNGTTDGHVDDDAAEASGKTQVEVAGGRGGKKTQGGQNQARTFGSSRDAIALCKARSTVNEFAPPNCPFGDKCRFEHDIRVYLKDGKRSDLDTFTCICPVWEVLGKCPAGWRCRFAGSHSKEIDHEDGRKELILITKDSASTASATNEDAEEDEAVGVVNVVSNADKITMRKKKWPTPKSDQYLPWLHKLQADEESGYARKKSDKPDDSTQQDHRAQYIEPPLRPSEKRRIYYGPDTPVLAPLTTQGNLPYRRLCVSLGAQVTWSEMAMSLPLISGDKSEWALVKAHSSELIPPTLSSTSNLPITYSPTTDLRFGVQLAANKPWLAIKATEILTSTCPSLRAIDLNCGCPIDMLYKSGAGSALLDSPGRLEKILRGMNTVSGEVPITVKIRMGTKDRVPTAEKLCQRLVLGGTETVFEAAGPAGVAAITLHGRSRQQRYSRSADWGYIAECASLVKGLREKRAETVDTVREVDARDLPAGNDGMPYFCGNGDVLSHVDYNSHMENAEVDSCMIGRGALIKPWLFEEIASNQYLDKSATERLGYIERFARNGLEYWGSDEIGVGTTRRFLLEWLSFACRYVPIGLLEYLPPKFGDRPPAFRGRSELETLLSSSNYKDWIKISEMFLGPAHKDFHFQPKHKSNSYEIEAEG